MESPITTDPVRAGRADSDLGVDLGPVSKVPNRPVGLVDLGVLNRRHLDTWALAGCPSPYAGRSCCGFGPRRLPTVGPATATDVACGVCGSSRPASAPCFAAQPAP